MSPALLTGGSLPDLTRLLAVIEQIGAGTVHEAAQHLDLGVGVLDHRETADGTYAEKVSTWRVTIGPDAYTLIQMVCGVLGEDGEAWAHQVLTPRLVPDLDAAAAIATDPDRDPADHRAFLAL